MSDLMLHGVLNMPLPENPAELDVVTWLQFKDRARQASSRIEELEAKLAEAVERVISLRGVLHKICDPNLICLPKDITTALNDTDTTLAELTGGNDE